MEGSSRGKEAYLGHFSVMYGSANCTLVSLNIVSMKENLYMENWEEKNVVKVSLASVITPVFFLSMEYFSCLIEGPGSSQTVGSEEEPEKGVHL